MDPQVFRCKVLNTLHVQEVFLKLSSLKYFLHVQSIQYFPCATSISEAIQFNKNTSCICKVFNTLYLNTWGSIYPTSKKYFLYVQSIQYFAPEYLEVYISNFKKILLAKYCKVFNTLHLNTWGSIYLTLKNTSCTC